MPASSYPLRPVDQIDDELAGLLVDSEIRARLEKDDAEYEGGDYLANTTEEICRTSFFTSLFPSCNTVFLPGSVVGFQLIRQELF